MTTATTTPQARPSDEELAPRLVARDEDAVALLLARWWPRAHALALQLVGDPALAEDVAQEAFVQVLRAAGEFDPARGAFAPWFLRVVRNAAFNASRARARRSGHEAAAARPEGHVDDPAERAATSVDAASLRAHLAALSAPYREAVALHCLQGLTFQEVSEVLDCPLGTVASRVRRGLDALRARLGAGSAGAATLALPDADLVALTVRAFADVAAPAAPTARAVLAAAAVVPPRPPARYAPRGGGSRLGALLTLAALLGAGMATFSLLMSEPSDGPPPAVVARTRTSSPAPVTSLDVTPASPTSLASTRPATPPPTTTADDPPLIDDEVQPGAVEAVAFDRLGERVAAGRRDGTAEVWGLKERVRVFRLVGHRARVTGVAFSPDGALVATASYDGTARVWETTRGSCVHVLTHSGSSKRRVLALAMSPDGQLLATGGEDGRVRLWALAQGELLATLEAHSRPVRALCFDRGGTTLLSAGEDHRLAVWNARGEHLLEVTADDGFTHALLDRDGTALAAAPLRVERYDLTLRQRVDSFVGEGPMALSPPTTPERDRGLLLRAGAGVLRLVEPSSGLDKVRLVDDDDVLLSWALSPDGAHAITGGESGLIKLWSLRPAPDEPPSTSLVRDEPLDVRDDAADRVVAADALDTDPASTTSRALPTPRGVDVDAVRRRLTQATVARRRELVAGLDARDAGGFVLLLEALAGGWSDWTVRQAAVEAVARLLGDPRVQAAAVRALGDPELPAGAREGLALSLGLTGSQAFLARLLGLLDDREWVVRRAAAIALVRLRDARSVEPLIAALEREEEPRVSALLRDALERLTLADPEDGDWKRWWRKWRHDFEVSRRGRSAVGRFEVVEVDRGRDRRPVEWSVVVRGTGRPVIVLPEAGYQPSYLALGLRWLERDHTVAYVVDPGGLRDDVTVLAQRLERLRQTLVALGALPHAPELIVAHGLSSLVATRYAYLRPEATGLLLLSPFSSAAAWGDAVRRVERADRHGDAARLLLRPPASFPVGPQEHEARASLRRDLFTSYFADQGDLFIGHLLGPRHEDERLRFVHELELVHEPAPPVEGLAPESWHEVRTAVVVGRRTPWDSPQDAQRVALRARRSRVIAAEAGRMAFYEDREAFVEALRWLEE